VGEICPLSPDGDVWTGERGRVRGKVIYFPLPLIRCTSGGRGPPFFSALGHFAPLMICQGPPPWVNNPS